MISLRIHTVLLIILFNVVSSTMAAPPPLPRGLIDLRYIIAPTEEVKRLQVRTDQTVKFLTGGIWEDVAPEILKQIHTLNHDSAIMRFEKRTNSEKYGVYRYALLDVEFKNKRAVLIEQFNIMKQLHNITNGVQSFEGINAHKKAEWYNLIEQNLTPSEQYLDDLGEVIFLTQKEAMVKEDLKLDATPTPAQVNGVISKAMTRISEIDEALARIDGDKKAIKEKMPKERRYIFWKQEDPQRAATLNRLREKEKQLEIVRGLYVQNGEEIIKQQSNTVRADLKTQFQQLSRKAWSNYFFESKSRLSEARKKAEASKR